MAILIMGKYAYVKLSIILYHKQMDLSIGFVEFLKNYFSNCLGVMKKSNEKAAIAACVSRFDSGEIVIKFISKAGNKWLYPHRPAYQ